VAIVNVGDAVAQFQPLVSGIDVIDKINTPNFVNNIVGRAGIQDFLTEEASRGPGDTDETKALTLLLEHTFLTQVSPSALISQDINLTNVFNFLRSIRPLNKTFFKNIIVGKYTDSLVPGESMQMSVDMDVTPTVDSNQTTLLPSSTLLTYETVDNPALDLDTDGLLCQESVIVQIYINGILTSTVLTDESGNELVTEAGEPIIT
jgi:hypothetical protein